MKTITALIALYFCNVLVTEAQDCTSGQIATCFDQHDYMRADPMNTCWTVEDFEQCLRETPCDIPAATQQETAVAKNNSYCYCSASLLTQCKSASDYDAVREPSILCGVVEEFRGCMTYCKVTQATEDAIAAKEYNSGITCSASTACLNTTVTECKTANAYDAADVSLFCGVVEAFRGCLIDCTIPKATEDDIAATESNLRNPCQANSSTDCTDTTVNQCKTSNDYSTAASSQFCGVVEAFRGCLIDCTIPKATEDAIAATESNLGNPCQVSGSTDCTDTTVNQCKTSNDYSTAVSSQFCGVVEAFTTCLNDCTITKATEDAISARATALGNPCSASTTLVCTDAEVNTCKTGNDFSAVSAKAEVCTKGDAFKDCLSGCVIPQASLDAIKAKAVELDHTCDCTTLAVSGCQTSNDYSTAVADTICSVADSFGTCLRACTVPTTVMKSILNKTLTLKAKCACNADKVAECLKANNYKTADKATICKVADAFELCLTNCDMSTATTTSVVNAKEDKGVVCTGNNGGDRMTSFSITLTVLSLFIAVK